MANTFKLITKAGVTSADVIYTVAGSTTTVILGLMIGNTTSSSVNATLTIESDTSARSGNNDEANQNVELLTTTPIPGNSSLELLGGNKNVAIGQQAGDALVSGDNNIIIGYRADASTSTTSNEITLGDANIKHLRVPGIGVSFNNTGGTQLGIITATELDISGDIDVDGTSNLDVTDIDGTLNVAGETTLQTHLNLGDNDRIKLGAGSDIQIYHDGTYSRIMETGGTALILDTTSANISLTADNSENMAKFIKNGAVQLFYDNSQKFSTTSAGATLTGNLTITDGHVSSGVTHTYNLYGATGTGGSASYVTYSFVGDPNTGMYSGTADTVKFATGGSERMRIDSSGNIGIGDSSPDAKLDVHGNVVFGDGGGFDMNINGTRHQFSIGGTERMRIDSSGNLGIGTTSVSHKLEVHSSGATNIVAKSTNGNGGYLNYSGLSSGGTTTFSVTHNGAVYAADGLFVGGTGSANQLDDYEEGTWSPYINNGSSNLGTSNVIATYTKIGRTVYAEFQIQRNDSSSDTNYFYIAGLPFTSINGPRLAGQAWIDNSSNDIKCFIYLGSNCTTASFPKPGGNDSAVSLNEFSNWISESVKKLSLIHI